MIYNENTMMTYLMSDEINAEIDEILAEECEAIQIVPQTQTANHKGSRLTKLTKLKNLIMPKKTQTANQQPDDRQM